MCSPSLWRYHGNIVGCIIDQTIPNTVEHTYETIIEIASGRNWIAWSCSSWKRANLWLLASRRQPHFGAAQLLTPTDLGNEQAPAAARIPHVLVAGCQPWQNHFSGWISGKSWASRGFWSGLTANTSAWCGILIQVWGGLPYTSHQRQ